MKGCATCGNGSKPNSSRLPKASSSTIGSVPKTEKRRTPRVPGYQSTRGDQHHTEFSTNK